MLYLNMGLHVKDILGHYINGFAIVYLLCVYFEMFLKIWSEPIQRPPFQENNGYFLYKALLHELQKASC